MELQNLSLALDFLGLLLTIIGFFILSGPPVKIRVEAVWGDKPRSNAYDEWHKQRVEIWNQGMRVSIIGFILQGISLWLSIAF